MSQNTYQCFVKRLREERIRLKLTQKQMADRMKMSENHYSKAEKERRRLSFFETKYLCETELDSFYIFTGRKIERNQASFFAQYQYAELLNYYEMVCMLVVRPNSRQKALSMEDKRIIDYARYLVATENREKTVFKKYREYKGFSQFHMAEKLGVDLKKLRELERGKLLPDSELIWKMSSQLYIPFSLILKDKNGVISEICCLLELMKPDSRGLVMEIMQKLEKIGDKG
ncbi:MAG: helix-turn-helix domain-containing protein [Lachnospiraceae bacterium]